MCVQQIQKKRCVICASVPDYTAHTSLHTRLYTTCTWPSLEAFTVHVLHLRAFWLMFHTADHCSEKRNYSSYLCIFMPFSSVFSYIFFLSTDLWCKWSQVEGRVASQLLRSAKLCIWTDYLFGVMNTCLPVPGDRGIMGGNVTGVIWHGLCCRVLQPCGLSRADELTSRNMWNNNDRKPTDCFSNIVLLDPEAIYPI